MLNTEAVEKPSPLAVWWNRAGKGIAIHLILTLIAVTTLAPFVWMVHASFKPLEEVDQINPLPTVWHPAGHPVRGVATVSGTGNPIGRGERMSSYTRSLPHAPAFGARLELHPQL